MAKKNIDQELVVRVQAGDKKAFDVLVLKYQHRITSLVSRFVRDHHEAQDVTQEAFIKAYKGLKNFRGESAFYTWLYRIAINTAKNHLVSMSRRPTSSSVEMEDIDFFDDSTGIRDISDPQGELATDQIHATVEHAIDILPDELKEAIVLRELEGMTYDEIATIMDCPIGTVRSRIFRARDAIEKHLRPLVDNT